MKTTIYILIFSIVLLSCKKEATIWESDWSSPLISDTLSLNNLVNDSTLAENSGGYLLDLDRTLFDLNITELVNIPDTTIAEDFAFSGTLILNPGVSFVNSIEEHNINIPDVQLKEIILTNGFIDVRVENPLGTVAIFNVKLPGVAKGGVTFEQTYFAPAAIGGNVGIVDQSIDLAGYSLDLTGVSGGEFNMLQSLITVQTDPLGPSVEITPSDITKVNATFRNIKVEYARGYFGNQIISDTSNVLIDALSAVHSGSLDLPATTIQFIIENGLKVTAEGSLTTVSNENYAGNIVSLTGGNIGTALNLDPATGSWNSLVPSLKVVEFNSSNSNIESYLENLGLQHKIGYSMQMNPWGNVSGGWDEVFPNSNLRIRMKATMPLMIGLDNLSVRDTFDVSLNQDPEKTRVISGELILQASNGFPISGTIKLHMINSEGNILYTVSGSNALNSSLVGDMNTDFGFFVANSEMHFFLPEELIDVLNDVKGIIVESNFNSNNPITGISEQQNIPFGAFLAIKLKTKFKTENRF
ncbi:hypothetical protein N9963_03490 [Crocinitomicaceae bacterium]|nr:hypothetical protein [Crocinitomicaceae bacterium]